VYNPMVITRMFQDGIITSQRREALLHNPFDADLTLFNAMSNEMPRTNLDTLELLPKFAKEKIIVCNNGYSSTVVEECAKRGLHLLQNGIENTKVIPLSDFEMGRVRTLTLLRLFCTNALSKAFPSDALPTLLENFVEHSFTEGDTIIADGMEDANSMVYLISKGSVQLYSEGEVLSEMRSGDIFAYFEDSHNQVIAKTDVEVYMCPRGVLQRVGRHGQDLLQAIKMHAFVQSSLSKSKVFGTLEPSQLAVVASCVSEVLHFAKDEKIIRQGDSSDKSMFIVHSGSVLVRISSKSLPHPIDVARLGPGSIVGEMAFLLHQPRSADVISCVPTTMLRIKEEELNMALLMFPNIRFFDFSCF